MLKGQANKGGEVWVVTCCDGEEGEASWGVILFPAEVICIDVTRGRTRDRKKGMDGRMKLHQKCLKCIVLGRG